jgi:hypothetical protein
VWRKGGTNFQRSPEVTVEKPECLFVQNISVCIVLEWNRGLLGENFVNSSLNKKGYIEKLSNADNFKSRKET